VGAQGEIGNTVAVGETIQFGNLAFVKEDYKWQPATGPLTHGQIVPVGEIGIFIGYVAAGDSSDGVRNNDQIDLADHIDDSNDGVADNDHTDLTEQIGDNIDAPEDGNFSIEYNSEDYSDSIDEEANYGSDEEPTPMESDPAPLSSGFTDPVGVYVVDDNSNPNPDILSTPISAANAAARAADLEAQRVTMLAASKAIEADKQKALDAAKVLESQRRELQYLSDYNRKRSAMLSGRVQARDLFESGTANQTTGQRPATRAAPATGGGAQRTTPPERQNPQAPNGGGQRVEQHNDVRRDNAEG
jgi:hypothetical protein